MIPEEVAEIAYLLREKYPRKDCSSEEEFNHSISVAWEIYNLCQLHEEQRIKGF